VKGTLTHIANPIYDVVFRYMMEDNRVARLFLSAVLGEEVDEERRTKNALIRRLHSLGLDIAGIARDTGMDEAEVRQVVEGD
jgi:predicted transposase YdaD